MIDRERKRERERERERDWVGEEKGRRDESQGRVCEGRREREKERERHTDRQTERQREIEKEKLGRSRDRGKCRK